MLKDVTVESGIYPHNVSVNGQKGIRVTKGNSPTGGHAGQCKVVYFVDDYVVKFGDMCEAELIIAEEDRKHFAEVVYADIDRQWYVQKRVNCIPNAEVTPEHDTLVRNLASQYNFGDVGIMDGAYYGTAEGIKIGHNFTLDLNGIPVIYDYSGY